MWGCERAYARSHPYIRLSITAIPNEPLFVNPLSILYQAFYPLLRDSKVERGKEKELCFDLTFTSY